MPTVKVKQLKGPKYQILFASLCQFLVFSNYLHWHTLLKAFIAPEKKQIVFDSDHSEIDPVKSMWFIVGSVCGALMYM